MTTTTTETNRQLPLFYQKLEILDSKKHKDLGIRKTPTDFRFAKQANVIPVLVSEVSLAAKSYPLVFVQEKDSAAPTVVALVSLGDNKNLFVDNSNQWKKGSYVPVWVRRYPFFSIKANEQNNAIAFDPTAELFKGKDLTPLFKDEKPTDALTNIIKFQGEFELAYQQTQTLSKALLDAGILEAATLTIGVPEKDKGPRNITGFMVVNEAKLKALDDAALIKLHKANALGLAYAQMFSMSNLQTLAADK
jgi:hypothetical protein